LRFDVQRVFVTGPPWDLIVGVEWIGHATPKLGEPYTNQGGHIIRLRRARVVYFHAYEDSQKVADACQRMAAAGIDEAAAAPIVD
jgi:ketosteroid isomerase-like protein